MGVDACVRPARHSLPLRLSSPFLQVMSWLCLGCSRLGSSLCAWPNTPARRGGTHHGGGGGGRHVSSHMLVFVCSGSCSHCIKGTTSLPEPREELFFCTMRRGGGACASPPPALYPQHCFCFPCLLCSSLVRRSDSACPDDLTNHTQDRVKLTADWVAMRRAVQGGEAGRRREGKGGAAGNAPQTVPSRLSFRAPVAAWCCRFGRWRGTEGVGFRAARAGPATPSDSDSRSIFGCC